MRCLLFLSLLCAAYGGKVLLICPGISRSQLIFNTEVANVLTNSGIDVTILVQAVVPQAFKFQPPNGTKAVIIKGDLENVWERVEPVMQKSAFDKEDMSVGFIKNMVKFFSSLTESTVKSGIIEELRKEKFDVGFAHIYNTGAVGILEAIGIESKVLLASGNFMDHFYWYMGVPVPWSYVPAPVMHFGDRMSFVQRFKNCFAYSVVTGVTKFVFMADENEILQNKYGKDFPRIENIVKDVQLAMVNAEEFLDLARPTMHKVVYIGGLGMSKGESKALDAEWSAKMQKGKKGVILFSLGTVASSKNMPAHMRTTLINGLKRVKDYHIIFRFEGDAPEAEGVENMDIVTWVPQKDLLNHPRLKLFFTHGGFNSVLESVSAAVPMVIMGLFGDQTGNAIRAERRGVGVGLNKLEITEDSVYEAVMKVLNDESYARNAKKLGRLIHKKPFSPEERIAQWTNFLIEFKTLDSLKPVSADLSIIEYFNLDVLAAVLAILFIAAHIIKYLILGVIRVCCGSRGSKTKAE